MKTLDLPFETVKPAHLYRFVWNAKKGPVVRFFGSPHLLDGYIKEIKLLAPDVSLTWVTPFAAVGCFP